MNRDIALTLQLIPILLLMVAYAVHLVREAKRLGAADTVTPRAERTSDPSSLADELREVRLELRALREALERGNNCRH